MLITSKTFEKVISKTWDGLKDITKKIVISITILMFILSAFAPLSLFAVTGDDVVNMARKKLGATYVWGGCHSLSAAANPNQNVFDCTGFIAWVLKQLNLPIKSTPPTNAMKNGALGVGKIVWQGAPGTFDKSMAQKGDILVSHESASQHASIYIENGKIIHAARPGVGVVEAPGDFHFKYVTTIIRVTDGNSAGIESTSTSKPQKINFAKLGIQDKNDFYYPGIQKGEAAINTSSILMLIVQFFKDILVFLLNFLIYIIRLPFIGWTVIFEFFTNLVLGQLVYGSVDIKKDRQLFSISDTSDLVTIENIIFNKVDALNPNFFIAPWEPDKDKTAAGNSRSKINEKVEKVGEDRINKKVTVAEARKAAGVGEEDKAKEETSKPVQALRKSFAFTYYFIFLITIGLSFGVFLIILIRGLLARDPRSQAEFKKNILSFGKAILMTFLYIFLMFFTLQFTGYVVELLYNIFIKDPSSGSIYQTLRTGAFAFSPAIGITSLILYMMLVWYTIRFTIVYFKRMFSIFVLAIIGGMMPIYEQFLQMFGKNDKPFQNWWKEFFMLTFIQVVHVGIYVIFVRTALEIGQQSITGIIFSIIIMKYMLEFSSVIRSLFSFAQGTSITGEVTKPPISFEETKAYTASIIGSRTAKRTISSFRNIFRTGKRLANEGLSSATAAAYNANQRRKERFREEEELEFRRQKEQQQQEAKELEGVATEEEKKLEQRELERKRLLEEAEKVSKQRIWKARIKDFFDLDALATVDKDGRKRILQRAQFYDPEQRRMIREDTILTKKLNAQKKFKVKKPNVKGILKSGFKAGMAAAGSIALLPIMTTDTAFATWAFFEVLDPEKKFKETQKAYNDYRLAVNKGRKYTLRLKNLKQQKYKFNRVDPRYLYTSAQRSQRYLEAQIAREEKQIQQSGINQRYRLSSQSQKVEDAKMALDAIPAFQLQAPDIQPTTKKQAKQKRKLVKKVNKKIVKINKEQIKAAKKMDEIERKKAIVARLANVKLEAVKGDLESQITKTSAIGKTETKKVLQKVTEKDKKQIVEKIAGFDSYEDMAKNKYQYDMQERNFSQANTVEERLESAVKVESLTRKQVSMVAKRFLLDSKDEKIIDILDYEKTLRKVMRFLDDNGNRYEIGDKEEFAKLVFEKLDEDLHKMMNDHKPGQSGVSELEKVNRLFGDKLEKTEKLVDEYIQVKKISNDTK